MNKAIAVTGIVALLTCAGCGGNSQLEEKTAKPQLETTNQSYSIDTKNVLYDDSIKERLSEVRRMYPGIIILPFITTNDSINGFLICGSGTANYDSAQIRPQIEYIVTGKKP